jgi:hypothetical protein
VDQFVSGNDGAVKQQTEKPTVKTTSRPPRAPAPPRPRAPSALAIVYLLTACAGSDNTGYTGLYERTVRQAIPAIEKSTGHKFKTPPKLQERTRDELRAFLENAFNDQTPALELAGIASSYKRFGLIPDTMDLRSYMLRLLDEQVVGYYDPKADVLYVMKDAAPELVGTTITHELVHALQDQYFPLDSLERIKTSNDRRTAGQAVAEGQAVWEQLVVLTHVPDPSKTMPGGWEGVRSMIRENQTNMPILDNAPTLLREVLLFPYLSGAEHIRQFKARYPNGWPFDSLPVSTEQILHADKYFGTVDNPTLVTLPPLRTGKSVYEGDLGEFETRLFLYEHTRNQSQSVAGAAGWDGDRYALVDLPGGGEGLIWVTVWDSPIDGAEFVDALETALPRRYKGLRRQASPGDQRRFEGAARTVMVRPVTVDGRSIVILTDVPAGTATDLIDPARIRMSQ